MDVLLFLLGATAAVVFGLWLFFSWHFGYWRRRGVVSCNPFSLKDDHDCGLSLSKPMCRMFDVLYDRYKDKQRFIGTFQGRRPVLLVLDPEVAKVVLTKAFGSFHDRDQSVDASDALSNNLFFLDGPRWKNLRVKLTPAFSSGKLKAMFPLMVGITEQLNTTVSKAAAKDDNREVELKDLLTRYCTDIIGSVACGIDCNTLSGENEDFRAMSLELHRNKFILVRSFLAAIHPALTRLMPFKSKFAAATQLLPALMRATVERREREHTERADLIQAMMQVREEDRRRSDLDRASHLELNYDNMAAQMMVFFAAGLDNVINPVGFALLELALNPELQRRVRAAVRGAKARHGGLTYEALSHMDIVERVVREALRKYSPIGLLRRATNVRSRFELPDSDVVIDDKVLVVVPIWQFMHDPALFPEPERFDPDRFTAEAKEARHPYAYLPFGEGPRHCIAERLAILEMKLCLAGLLDKHHFEVGSKTEPTPQLDPKSSAPTPTAGFWLRVRDVENE